jgi:hypothetical protein
MFDVLHRGIQIMLQEFAGALKAFQVGFQFIISPIWLKGKFAGKPMKTLYIYYILTGKNCGFR